MICSIRQHLEIPEASHCPVLLHIACMHMHNMYIHISEGKPEVSYSAEFACSVYPQYAKDPGPRSQMFLASYTTEQHSSEWTGYCFQQCIQTERSMSLTVYLLFLLILKFGKSSSTCQLAEIAIGAVSSESNQQQREEDREQEEVHSDPCACSLSVFGCQEFQQLVSVFILI